MNRMRIGSRAAKGEQPEGAHLKATLVVAVLGALIAGTGCRPTPIEVANETAGTIMVTAFVEGNPYSPFVDEVAPGEVITLEVGSVEERWEISDESGVVVMEVIVSSRLADFYDGRIVVR